MKEVVLSMEEQTKYEVIKELVDHGGGNKLRASKKLGCTVRHVNRMIAGYKEEGEEFFSHGNRGRKPSNAIPQSTRDEVVDLYQSTYFGANFSHYTYLLEKNHEIKLSEGSVTEILESKKIYSPYITNEKWKRIRAELKEKEKEAKTGKEAKEIQKNILSLDSAHSRRPRCKYYGELIQMDASSHHWFGDEKTTLHIGIDDCTGRLVGGWFDKEETLNGYYHLTAQMLGNIGIPFRILTDCRTVFTYKQSKSPKIEEDSITQYGYACKKLGIDLKTSSVPQVKGRVERAFLTLQERLPIEMRVAGVKTIDEANEFFAGFMEEFNKQFALPVDYNTSVFERQLTAEEINLTLAVLSERTVDCGQCIQYKNHYYRLLDSRGVQVNYRSGTKVVIIKALDGQLFTCVEGKAMCALEQVPKRAAKSQNFDYDCKKSRPTPRKIPEMQNQWNRSDFRKFIRSQKHHENDLEYMFDELEEG